MSPKKRITKKEMKEDKLVTLTFRITELFQKYTNQFLVGIGVVVVAGVLVYFYINSKANQEREASVLLGQADLQLRIGNTKQALSGLDMVTKRFPETKAGKRAIFLLGDAYFQSREFQLAKSAFERYLSQGKEPLLKASAQAGIAQCYLETGDLLLAGDSFLKAASMTTEDFMKQEYLFSAAWVFSRTGQKEKAREVYRELLDKYPQSTQAQQARLNLAEMS
ncbi:MAG: tetratricopeptide repeat protein [candidate division Zixibacteria bacterium]|nr:tetratricopeptide repeat protein [candidate division Zixibacteria bacterium]